MTWQTAVEACTVPELSRLFGGNLFGFADMHHIAVKAVGHFGSEAWTRTRINGVRVRCATNCTTSEQLFGPRDLALS